MSTGSSSRIWMAGRAVAAERHRITLGSGCEQVVHRRGLGRALMTHAAAFGFEAAGRRSDRFKIIIDKSTS
ncbi:hypothetical protein [Burkholderia ubonensis]|uniref:hypothetical protein n=1 Tax=Burkholderia ubonensis TaxID=101571 RepID=UPI0005F03C88|nr:hypothetical protein [Burkholderia ubonensis]